jgi:hypothetical protein
VASVIVPPLPHQRAALWQIDRYVSVVLLAQHWSSASAPGKLRPAVVRGVPKLWIPALTARCAMGACVSAPTPTVHSASLSVDFPNNLRWVTFLRPVACFLLMVHRALTELILRF